MRRTPFLFVLFLFFVLRGLPVSGQLVISQMTTLSEDLEAADLSIPDEAGADLQSSFVSAPDFNQLDILNMASSQGWKISVSRRDINWPAAFVPYIQRTSSGVPCGTCAGVNPVTSVNGYLQITSMEQYFIYGTGEVTGIDVQFKVEGISLSVQADSYSTEVIFTIYGD